MQPQVITTAAGPIEVADVGSGPAVIVVHGMPGDWSQAAPLGRALSDTHRVLLVSRPGYGRTPLTSARTPEDTAALYAALLDTLDIDRAGIIGISGGGPSSFAFAAHQRDRCSALALVCAVNTDVMPAPRALKIFHALPGIREALWALAARKEQRAIQDEDAVLAQLLEEANPIERARADADPIIREQMLEFARHHARVGAHYRAFRHDLSVILRRQRRGHQLAWPDGASVPTLILHGSADEVVSEINASAYAALIPGAEVEVYEGGSHAFLISFRIEATERLRRHVSGVSAA